MLLDVLYRIHAAPFEHLGCRSLDRVRTFELGYGFFLPAREFPVGVHLRDFIIRLYQLEPDSVAKFNAYSILSSIAPNDEVAFDLFFQHLSSLLGASPDILNSPIARGDREGQPPLPVSGFLNVLEARPLMFLRRRTPGELRAFLDGYGLACVDNGFFDCADLDGFEHWVRKRLCIRGMFRWENAVLSEFEGREEDAFGWAIRELKSYRESLGPLSTRNFEIVFVDGNQAVETDVNRNKIP